MKIFDQVEPWYNKVNFVDENNVVLGYDLSQDCCEHADWYISESEKSSYSYESKHEQILEENDLSEYIFDVDFEPFYDYDNNCLDEGSDIAFRITNGKKELFIHIFNAHNGYYGHGFEFMVKDKKILDGYI